MDVFQAITERKSIRKYKSDPVPDELILRCIEAARLAPSWANTQVSRFVVVKDRAVREALGATMSEKNPARPAFLAAPCVDLYRCPARRFRHEEGRAGYRQRRLVHV